MSIEKIDRLLRYYRFDRSNQELHKDPNEDVFF